MRGWPFVSHFKEKNLRSVYRWLCQCWVVLGFFPPEIINFVSGSGSGDVQMVVVYRIITLWAEGSM